MDNPPTPPAVADRAQLRRRALELRRDGASYIEIAEALGVSGSRAYRLVGRELDAIRRAGRETAAEALELELLRLDAMTRVASAILADGRQPDRQLRAIDRLLKVSDLRCRLLGPYVRGGLAGAAAGTMPVPVNDDELADHVLELPGLGKAARRELQPGEQKP